MIPYAQLRPGRGFSLGRAAAYYAQRLVTNRVARRCVTNALAGTVRLKHGRFSTGDAPEVEDTLGKLKQDGIAMLPCLWSASELLDVIQYFAGQPVAHTTATTAAYSLESIVAAPWLIAAVNRPEILRLASAFLGCKPTLQSLGVRWSYPGPASHDVQSFHRDPDDWRFLKLFVYLTAVDDKSGPHVYVAGTHRMRRSWRARTYGYADVEAKFGKEHLRTILGACGTTFAADTSGLHAGIPPQKSPRLLFQAQYSILPNYGLRYEPVSDTAHRVDRYVNRLILAR